VIGTELGASLAMFHIELRQFPRNVCRFNLEARELDARVLGPWARGEWFELGELKWNPHQARLTIIEGPQIPPARLSMGRGWKTALREGRDVTERLTADARARVEHAQAQPAPARAAPVPAAPSPEAAAVSAILPPSTAGHKLGGNATGSEVDLLADSFALALLGEIGAEATTLSQVWGVSSERHPDRSAAETLTLAERAVRSLIARGLVKLVELGEPAGAGQERNDGERNDQDIERVLRAPSSWASRASVPTLEPGSTAGAFAIGIKRA
jgi:hypothetical protein